MNSPFHLTVRRTLNRMTRPWEPASACGHSRTLKESAYRAPQAPYKSESALRSANYAQSSAGQLWMAASIENIFQVASGAFKSPNSIVLPGFSACLASFSAGDRRFQSTKSAPSSGSNCRRMISNLAGHMYPRLDGSMARSTFIAKQRPQLPLVGDKRLDQHSLTRSK